MNGKRGLLERLSPEFVPSGSPLNPLAAPSCAMGLPKPARKPQPKHRAGDWVCLLCTNHNYSFREVCNRCKIQTKEQNILQSLVILQNQNMSQNSNQNLGQNYLPSQNSQEEKSFSRSLWGTRPNEGVSSSDRGGYTESGIGRVREPFRDITNEVWGVVESAQLEEETGDIEEAGKERLRDFLNLDN